jgi:IS605 OrfB family transposase
VRVIHAYRFALAPTPEQERGLYSHAGAARFAWNWGLTRCKENYEREGKWLNSFQMHKLWNEVKKADQELSWWSENSKCAYQEAFADLHRSLLRFALSRKGMRRGAKQGFPSFKKLGRCRPAFRLTPGRPGTIRCSGSSVTLPRLGVIKTHESTRKLARRLESGSARVLNAAVSYDGRRWYVSLTCEVDRDDRRASNPDSVVGVDLGIKHLAVLSTGELIDNPRHLNTAQRKLRKLARRSARRVGPYDVSAQSARVPSKRWKKAKEQLSLAHAKVANLRRDAIHKVTSRLVAHHGTIVIESLNVAGMVRNRKLARHVSDAAFGEIRRQLAYKTTWRGSRLLLADRWFPSSKTCSGCSAVKTKLLLSERTYVCAKCGLTLDRDQNAARNLAALAAKIDVAASGAETLNGRGADRKTLLAGLVAVKRQPGTASAGQTGTALPQGRAAANPP